MKSSKAFNAAVAVALVAAVALTVCLMAFPQLLGGENSAVAETYEDKVFGTGGILSVDISVKESDWESMLANATAEEYIPCDVTVDGYTVSVAGIRCKGNSSLSSVFSSDSERYSFKVEFDHYAAGRSLYGLDKLALNDCYADASYMKEYLSYEMFRSLGVATPLCAFANITVNGEPWGLYLAVECIEESFALRNYGAENINLYKPESDDMGRGGNFGGGKGAFGLGDAQNQPDAGSILPEEMQLPEGFRESLEGHRCPHQRQRKHCLRHLQSHGQHCLRTAHKYSGQHDDQREHAGQKQCLHDTLQLPDRQDCSPRQQYCQHRHRKDSIARECAQKNEKKR